MRPESAVRTASGTPSEPVHPAGVAQTPNTPASRRRYARYLPGGCIYRGDEETCCFCGIHWDEAPRYCECNEPADPYRDEVYL